MFEKEFNDEKLKNLIRIDKELTVYLREINTIDKEKLQEILKQNLNQEDEIDFLNQVNNIVLKGKISSNKEYKIILQRVESIYDDIDKEPELEKLNELLSNFHK